MLGASSYVGHLGSFGQSPLESTWEGAVVGDIKGEQQLRLAGERAQIVPIAGPRPQHVCLCHTVGEGGSHRSVERVLLRRGTPRNAFEAMQLKLYNVHEVEEIIMEAAITWKFRPPPPVPTHSDASVLLPSLDVRHFQTFGPFHLITLAKELCAHAPPHPCAPPDLHSPATAPL